MNQQKIQKTFFVIIFRNSAFKGLSSSRFYIIQKKILLPYFKKSRFNELEIFFSRLPNEDGLVKVSVDFTL